jgi:hypothetical protein
VRLSGLAPALLALLACSPEPRPVPAAEPDPAAVAAAEARREIRQEASCEAPLPSGAAETLDGVRRAAASGNPRALRPWMAKEFTWSFGGDADAGQAIEAWSRDPRALRELAAILDRGCVERAEKPEIVCPLEYETEPEYLGYRAGFRLQDDGWKMVFFVAGD